MHIKVRFVPEVTSSKTDPFRSNKGMSGNVKMLTSSITHCELCNTSLSNQLAYILRTQHLEDKHPIAIVVGMQCCYVPGHHGKHITEYKKRHKEEASMKVELHDSVTNLKHVKSEIWRLRKTGEEDAADRGHANMLKIYNTLSDADKALVDAYDPSV